MKNIFIIILSICFVVQIFYSGVSAEDEGSADYAWGVVTDVSSDRIIVSEYDYSTDEGIETSYTLSPNIKLVNVNSVGEIAVGNYVEIEFLMKGSDKIANVITVEALEEEYAPAEAYDEESEY